jgi:hypothetical protein
VFTARYGLNVLNTKQVDFHLLRFKTKSINTSRQCSRLRLFARSYCCAVYLGSCSGVLRTGSASGVRNEVS